VIGFDTLNLLKNQEEVDFLAFTLKFLMNVCLTLTPFEVVAYYVRHKVILLGGGNNETVSAGNNLSPVSCRTGVCPVRNKEKEAKAL
jgi:hypothetical protein